MAESSLEKVLRLAGGTTNAYVHTVNGRPVAVHAYPTPHPATAQAQAQPQQAAPAAPHMPAGTQAFGQLRKGQVVQIRNQNYKVAQVNVPPSTGSGTATGSKGQGVNTASTAAGAAAAATAQSNKQAATAAAQAAALFGTPKQNPQQAALNGKTIPKGTPTVTNQLTSLASGYTWFVTLPASFAVKVVG